jgi:hypothetical protein
VPQRLLEDSAQEIIRARSPDADVMAGRPATDRLQSELNAAVSHLPLPQAQAARLATALALLQRVAELDPSPHDTNPPPPPDKPLQKPVVAKFFRTLR